MRFLLIAIFSSMTAYASDCISLSNKFFQVSHRTNLEFFWDREQPFLIGENTNRLPLTFSFDSEVSLEDSLRLIYKDTEAQMELAKIPELNMEHPIDFLRGYLATSDAQFKQFALRKGVDKNKKSYRILDLNPSYAQKILDTISFLLGSLHASIGEQVKTVLRKNGLPVETHIDLSNIEITHESFEVIPHNLKKIVADELHNRFKSPMTHLHIGFPAEIISTEQFYAVSMAIEARSVLRLAETWRVGDQPLSYFWGSLLSNRSDPSHPRGVIRANVGRWKKPVLMHDLELRQYTSLDEGLENIALAAMLGRNYSKIRNVFFEKDYGIDGFTGNLGGALFYATKILEKSKNINDHKIAEDLLIFLNRIEEIINREGFLKVDVDLWEEIAIYLKKHNVVDRLNFENLIDPS